MGGGLSGPPPHLNDGRVIACSAAHPPAIWEVKPTKINLSLFGRCEEEGSEGDGGEPGDLVAKVAGPQAEQAGFSPHATLAAAAERLGGSGDSRSRLVAGQAPKTVVAKRKLDKRIGLRAAKVRARAARRQYGKHHPPSGADDHGAQCHKGIEQAARPGRGRKKEHRQAKAGQHQKYLELLGQKAQANQQAGDGVPAGASAVTVTAGRQLESAQHTGGGAQHKQDKQGIGVIKAEHERRDGRGDKHDAGGDARSIAPNTAHGGV